MTGMTFPRFSYTTRSVHQLPRYMYMIWTMYMYMWM